MLPTGSEEKSAWISQKIGKIGILRLQKSAENRPLFCQNFLTFWPPWPFLLHFYVTIFSKSKFLRNFFLKLSQNFGNFERLRYLRTSISVQILTQFFLTKFLIKHYFAVQNRPKKAHFGPKMGQNWPYFGPRNRQKVAILGSKIGSRFWQNLHRLQGSEKRPFADKSAELATLRIFRLQWLGRDYSWIFVCWHNFL